MSIHLNSLYTGQYRGLKSVELRDFNHINIITGKNNSGKTSLLEVLYTIGNPLWGESWFQAVYSRQAGTSIFSELERMIPFGSNEIDYSFNMARDEQEHTVRLSAVVADTMVTNKELMRLNGYIQTGAPKAENDIPSPTKQLQLSIEFDNEKREFGIYEQQMAINTKGRDKQVFLPTNYLVSAAHFPNVGIYLIPIFKENILYNSVLEVLQEFDKSITGLNYIDNECFIYSRNQDRAVPLGAYGDGLKKAIVIMSAIANARHGIVLLDEFETSIHMSAMQEMFRCVIKAAKKFDVQLFMTSHNEAAIMSILKAGEEICKDCNVYTLFNKNGKTLPRLLDGETALDVTSWGITL